MFVTSPASGNINPYYAVLTLKLPTLDPLHACERPS